MEEELAKTSPQNLRCLVSLLMEKFGDEASALVREKLNLLRKCWMTEIPHDVVSSVLSIWLNPTDLCRLDTSFCGEDVRRIYLQWCSLDSTVLHSCIPHELYDRHYFNWLTLRKLKVRNVVVKPDTVGELSLILMSYLAMAGNTVGSLSLAIHNSRVVDRECIRNVLSLCPNVTCLDLDPSDINATLFDQIFSSLVKLRELNISRVRISSDLVTEAAEPGEGRWDGFPLRPIACIALEELYLRHDLYVTDTNIASIAKACPRLRKVYLSASALLTSGAVVALSSHCSLLAELNIDGISDGMLTSDETMHALSAGCPLLRVLSANFALASASDDGVLALFSGCPRLTHVHLARNQRITDLSLKDLHLKCPDLRVIELNGCRNLTSAGVLGLIRHCSALEVLAIRDFTPQFDQEVRRELFEKKLWLGPWKDRNLKIQQTSKV